MEGTSRKRKGSGSGSRSRSRKRIKASLERKQKELSLERKITAAADRRDAEFQHFAEERKRSGERKQAKLAEVGRLQTVRANMSTASRERLKEFDRALRLVLGSGGNNDLVGLGTEFVMSTEEEQTRNALTRFRKQKEECLREHKECTWQATVMRPIPHTLLNPSVNSQRHVPPIKIGTTVIISSMGFIVIGDQIISLTRLERLLDYLSPMTNWRYEK